MLIASKLWPTLRNQSMNVCQIQSTLNVALSTQKSHSSFRFCDKQQQLGYDGMTDKLQIWVKWLMSPLPPPAFTVWGRSVLVLGISVLCEHQHGLQNYFEGLVFFVSLRKFMKSWRIWGDWYRSTGWSWAIEKATSIECSLTKHQLIWRNRVMVETHYWQAKQPRDKEINRLHMLLDKITVACKNLIT